MAGAGIAPRERQYVFATTLVVSLLLFLFCVPAAGATQTTSAVVDFSEHGQGPFDQSFFQADGTSFNEGSYVGYIQGDDSLIGPVGASTKSKFTNISASLAPAVQGTAAYTLTAFTRSGREIASNSVIVTQDTGEPGTEPFGYFTVALGPLPTRAGSFRISNRFIRSSYSHITLIDFGVASLSWSG